MVSVVFVLLPTLKLSQRLQTLEAAIASSSCPDKLPVRPLDGESFMAEHPVQERLRNNESEKVYLGERAFE